MINASLLGPRNFARELPALAFRIFLASFSPSPHRSHGRTIAVVVEHDFDFAEDKSQFVYVSFEDRDGVL